MKGSLPSISVNKHNKNMNPSSNKNDTNLIETLTSTKNKMANVLDSLTKKIHFLEFMQRHNINSVEYYLNNYLKNKHLENNQEDDPAQMGNSSIRKINTNTVNASQEEEEIIPYNINEHEMPLLDEENIIKILKNNDYFQDQTNDIFNLVLNETIYISVFKGMKIYDINDTSNYFFIINKGSVNLEKMKIIDNIMKIAIKRLWAMGIIW